MIFHCGRRRKKRASNPQSLSHPAMTIKGASNVGILAIQAYFPNTYVSQADLGTFAR